MGDNLRFGKKLEYFSLISNKVGVIITFFLLYLSVDQAC